MKAAENHVSVALVVLIFECRLDIIKVKATKHTHYSSLESNQRAVPYFFLSLIINNNYYYPAKSHRISPGA